jgi:hypothetical protein
VTDDLPVIDLDDTPENMNWLRIVDAMRQHDAGELTDEQYERRLAELRGEVPPSDPGDPGVLWSHAAPGQTDSGPGADSSGDSPAPSGGVARPLTLPPRPTATKCTLRRRTPR